MWKNEEKKEKRNASGEIKNIKAEKKGDETNECGKKKGKLRRQEKEKRERK